MERSFLNFKMERLWQRGYANHTEAQVDIADYMSASTTPSVGTPRWDTALRVSTSNSAWRPTKLPHSPIGLSEKT